MPLPVPGHPPFRSNLRVVGWLLLVSGLLLGCASSAGRNSPVASRANEELRSAKVHTGGGHVHRAAPAPSATYSAKSSELLGSIAPSPLENEEISTPADETVEAPSPTVVRSTPVGPAQARQVSYRGQLRVASLDPDALLDTAENRVSTLGGYVQSRSGRSMVLQVPAANFTKLFEQIRALGEVQMSRRSAEDLTEAVEGNDLELKLRRNQLSRLKAILTRETKVEGRAALLQEILMLQRIRYSRLDLDAVALAAPPPRLSVPPPSMQWISSLFYDSPPEFANGDSRALELAHSPEFVRTSTESDKFAWSAASSDGALVQAWRLEVRPDGDADFWRESVAHFRGREFASADTSRIGAWSLLRLPSFDPSGAVWWLATRRPPGEGKLLVVQCRFTPAQEKRLGPAVRKMIEETTP